MAPTSLVIEASLGKMPAMLVRRLVSARSDGAGDEDEEDSGFIPIAAATIGDKPPMDFSCPSPRLKPRIANDRIMRDVPCRRERARRPRPYRCSVMPSSATSTCVSSSALAAVTGTNTAILWASSSPPGPALPFRPSCPTSYTFRLPVSLNLRVNTEATAALI